MSKARQIVRVDWVDSCTSTGWQNAKSAKTNRDMRCTSIGFLTEDESDQITITSHLAWPDSSDPQVNTSMTIPRCAITKIRKLGASLDEPPKYRKKR